MKNEINNEEIKSLGFINQIREPRLYEVVIHNDDFTPMEFVVSILEKFFYMDRRKAADIMLLAHLQGKASCGVFNKDVAESKIAQIEDYVKLNQHPFRCDMEVV